MDTGRAESRDSRLLSDIYGRGSRRNIEFVTEAAVPFLLVIVP